MKKQETKTEIKPKEEIEDKKEPDLEKVEEGTVKIEVFKNYFNAIGIPYMAVMVLCYFGSHGATVGNYVEVFFQSFYRNFLPEMFSGATFIDHSKLVF